MRLFNSEPLMRNAAFQRMMYDAGKFRLMTKAKDAAAAKPLPRVAAAGYGDDAIRARTAPISERSAAGFPLRATSRTRSRFIRRGNPARVELRGQVSLDRTQAQLPHQRSYPGALDGILAMSWVPGLT